MPCTGDSAQTCGAGWRIQLVGFGAASSTTTSAGSIATADPLGMPDGWTTAYACAADDSSRILSQSNTLDDNSPANCAQVCDDKGFAIAGVEYGGVHSRLER